MVFAVPTPRRPHLSLVWLALLALSAPAGASSSDGSVILRMCRGADKVKALSVMCHSYLNGFMDGAHHYGKVSFCLGEGDKEKAPGALVDWITAHPEAQTQPAGDVVHKALTERFPCKGKK
jgi:hypothetical protein